MPPPRHESSVGPPSRRQSMTRRSIRSRPGALTAAGALVAGALTIPVAVGASPDRAASPNAGCTDVDVALTYEEQFLSRPEPGRFIDGGGFTDTVEAFHRALCNADSLTAARLVVHEHSRGLWKLAVAWVQDKAEPGGTPSDGDDRPLYWTRLAMSAPLRQWDPGFALTEHDRTALISDLDRISRGKDDIPLPTGQEGDAGPGHRFRPLHARPRHPSGQPLRRQRPGPGRCDGEGTGRPDPA